MKLYTFESAPNPRRVELFCQYKGIKLEKVAVNMLKGEHLTTEFLDKNPLGKVPVLELDSGEYLSESLAICQYLENCFPEKSLFGEDKEENAKIWMWSLRMSDLLEFPAEQAFRHLHASMSSRVEQVPSWGEQNQRGITKGFQFLEQHLSQLPYVCGKYISMADIVAYCGIGFAKVSKVSIEDSCSNLLDWHQRMDAIFRK